MSGLRPEVVGITSVEELKRWYLTKAELVEIARHHDIPTQGVKEVLLQRIVASFEGRVDCQGEETPRHRIEGKSGNYEFLSPPFNAAMIVPSGQSFTRELRSWLSQQLGREVRVTQPMRDFMRKPDGRNLGDLIAVAKAPRTRREIPPQFELNRFMRVLSMKYPDMSQSERKEAWQDFRRRPASERAEILGGEVITGDSE